MCTAYLLQCKVLEIFTRKNLKLYVWLACTSVGQHSCRQLGVTRYKTWGTSLVCSQEEPIPGNSLVIDLPFQCFLQTRVVRTLISWSRFVSSIISENQGGLGRLSEWTAPRCSLYHSVTGIRPQIRPLICPHAACRGHPGREVCWLLALCLFYFRTFLFST